MYALTYIDGKIFFNRFDLHREEIFQCGVVMPVYLFAIAYLLVGK